MSITFSARSQCDGKRTYLSRHEAKAAIKARMSTGLEPLKAYRCPHCDRFHLGHNNWQGKRRH